MWIPFIIHTLGPPDSKVDGRQKGCLRSMSGEERDPEIDFFLKYREKKKKGGGGGGV